MTVAVWDPWCLPCTCGHLMRDHRLDWGHPDDGVTPDCDHCGCMDFEPVRAD